MLDKYDSYTVKVKNFFGGYFLTNVTRYYGFTYIYVYI